MGTPDLLGIPTEMIALITEYLPVDSLLRLRLSCKAIEGATRSLVARRCFTNRAFFIADERSLKVLLEISKHETFSKSIKRIFFSFAVVTDPEGFSIDLESATGNGLRLHADERRREKESRKAYRRLFEAQRTFERRDGDILHLKDILSNFKSNGNIPALIASGQPFEPYTDIVYSHASLHPIAWGYLKIRDELRDREDLNICYVKQRPYHALNAAISMTDFPITHLELGWERIGVHYRSHIFDSTYKASYAQLKNLRLRIWAGDEGAHTRLTEVVLSNYCRFFLDMKELEEMSLSSGSCSSPSVAFDAVVSAAMAAPSARSFQNIKVLELESIQIDFAQLVSFVGVTHQTLRRLILSDVTFRGKRPTDATTMLREAHGGYDFDVKIDNCFHSTQNGFT